MFVVWAIVSANANGQVPSVESAVKAAFVFNILKFVEWTEPTANDGLELSVCMWGQDSLGGALDVLNSKQVREQKIRVQYVPTESSPLKCDVIYVGKGINDRSDYYKKALSDRHTFTLSEHKNFIRSGGNVEFYISDERIRFRMNQNELDAKAYIIGSRLLEFAR